MNNKTHSIRVVRIGTPSSFPFRIAVIVAICLTIAPVAFGKTGESNTAFKPRLLQTKPTGTTISDSARLMGVVVKFADDLKVRSALSRGAVNLTSVSGGDISRVLTAIDPYLKSRGVRQLIEESPASLDQRRERGEVRLGRKLADLAGYYAIEVTSPSEATALVNRLNAFPEVEIAYAMPHPEPAGFFEAATPNYDPQQAYLRVAPGGVDADYARTIPGAGGAGIKFIDIEGGWRTGHEDLLANPPFVQLGGQLDLSWRNHGTAVVGEILGNDNGTGVTGISPDVQWGYSSIGSQSTAGALSNAGNNLDTGDVILIELHAPGPHYAFENRTDQLGFVCMEYFNAEFNAILQLFAEGIIVCEAAGNGAEDFDDQNIYDQLFDTTSRNSHAIMCGAGAPPSGLYGPDRSKLSFSNFGERVNLQGYGRGVVTLGYGDLFGGTEDTYYTAFFSGTSSASPIVTGSVIAMQGAFKTAFAKVMDADEMRTTLVANGSLQVGGSHIGPRPNLQSSLNEVLGVSLSADTTFGIVPFDVQFSGQSAKVVTDWDWDFGDGGASVLQSPAYQYTAPGLFTVGLSVQTTSGPYATTRTQMIAAVADTLIADSASGAPGSSARVDIYARNTLPTRQINIPFTWTGPLGLTFDSISTVGLRTDYLDVKDMIHFDDFVGQGTCRLFASNISVTPALAPGTGPVVSLYFSIPPGATSGDNSLVVGPYPGYAPLYVTSRANYAPALQSGALSVCTKAGDADGDGSIAISDAVYLISYIFTNGAPPSPLGRGDSNCDISVDISDVIFIISYIFLGGAAPCSCAP